MARYTGPKCRLCRREGTKLYLKGEKCFTSKCPLEKRPYPPGVHGRAKARAKKSVYGEQLREKQKVKRIYGVLERQFSRYFEIAQNMPGNVGENLLSLLESRLDNVVYRAGFAHSRSMARQLVSHGHVLVNGKKVDIPSYLVKPGDVVSLKEKIRENIEVKKAMEWRRKSPSALPTWLELLNDYEVKVIRTPQRSDITYPINERLIVEFYSKF